MLAPILVTVYNRTNHFRKCIERLQQCELASESILYVSSDAAYRVRDEQAVEVVRRYAQSITGFKNVVLLFHKKNKGLAACYTESFNLVFEQYDKLIFLEDDVVVSRDFLRFINDSLDFYRDYKQVYSISAFSLSVFYPELIKNDSVVYFSHRHNPWGFGIWKDRFLSGNEYDLNDVKNSLRNNIFVNKLKNIGEDLYPAFLSILVKNKNLSVDYVSVYHMVKNDLVTVVPYHSKSFNIGNDGSGTRTLKSKRYTSVDLSFLNNSVDYWLTSDISGNINDSFNRINYNSRKDRYKLILYRLGILSVCLSLNSIIRNFYRKNANK